MAALGVFLTVACGFDYWKRKIPNRLLFCIAACSICMGFLENGWLGVGSYLLKAAGVMAIFFCFFRIGVIGAGDVKLFGVVAGVLPSEKILSFLFCTFLMAGFLAGFKLIKQKNFRTRFSYLLCYVEEVWQRGKFKTYHSEQEDGCDVRIPLAGPVLISFLLGWGGVY